MAFTRVYDDQERQKHKIDQDHGSLNYLINVPGNGIHPFYIDDPHIRLQKFGGNISKNIIDLDSNLKGMNMDLTKGGETKSGGRKGNNIINNNFNKNIYPNKFQAITDQSRTMNPAWTLRDLDKSNWAYLPKNPQDNYDMQFANNISSRIIEKDKFININ